MTGNLLEYEVYIDLPVEVDFEDVGEHLQCNMLCEVVSVSQVELEREPKKDRKRMRGLFNLGNFNRYKVQMKFPFDLEYPEKYIEKNVHSNVVSCFNKREPYTPPETEGGSE